MREYSPRQLKLWYISRNLSHLHGFCMKNTDDRLTPCLPMVAMTAAIWLLSSNQGLRGRAGNPAPGFAN